MGEPEKKPLNALEKVWLKMLRDKWTCTACGVLVDDKKKICPACEAPSPAPARRKPSNTSSSGGLFSGTSTTASNKPPSFNWALTPSTASNKTTSVAPTFNTNLFNQPKTGGPAPSAPVFNMGFFNKPNAEKADKPPLCPQPGNDSPLAEDKKGSIPDTPSIPFLKFNMIGIHSPLSIMGETPKSGDMVLKILDPHRDLPAGTDIVMTCGFGGFAQLGLGEEEDEEDDAKDVETPGTAREEEMPQMKGQDDVKMEPASVDFTAKAPQAVGAESAKRPRTSSEAEADFMMGTPVNPTKRQKVKWPAPNVVEAPIPLRMPNLDGLKIASVVMGVMHGAALTNAGRIFVWGGNDHSNLGFKGDDAWVPTDITKHFPMDTKIKKVTCGSSHTVFLTTDGKVFTAGTFKNDGWEGAFYDPTKKKVYKRLDKPTRLEYVKSANTSRGDGEQKRMAKMQDIASGLDHMLMLDVDGNLWEMGITILGQRTSKRNQHTYLQPRRVGLKKQGVKFIAIRCGSHYNLAISRDHDLYTWGQNNYLQCGHPQRPRQSNPELIDLPHKVNFNDPSVKVLDVGAGTHTTIALDTSGRLWSFGRNGSFELGRETTVPPKEMIDGRLQQYTNEPKPDLAKQVTMIDKQIVKISVGANHWFAVSRDSTTYAVGVNLEFRTGVGEEEGSSRFAKIFHDGNLRQDFEVVDVAAGSNSSVFLLKRVTRRARKPKRTLSGTPLRRVKRKMQVMQNK